MAALGVVLLACSLAVASAGLKNPSTPSNTSGVHLLNLDTFDAFIDAHPTVVVQFTVPWCDYCRALRPEMEQVPALAAASMPDGEDFPAVFAHVDCEEEPEFKDRFGVEVFPAFKLFRDALPEDLGNGLTPKTGEAVVAATRRSLGLTPTTYAHEMSGVLDLGHWLFYRGWGDLSMQTTLMGFFPDAATGADAAERREAFEGAAASLFATIRAGFTSDVEVMKAYGLPTDTPSVVLYKSYDEGKMVYDGVWSAAAIKTWAETWSHPLATVIDRTTLRRWQNSVSTLLHLFVDERGTQEPRSRLAFLDQLRSVGRALEADSVVARGDMLMTVVDGKQHAAWLKDFGLTGVELPVLALVDTSTHRFYAMGATVGDLGTVGDADPEDPTAGDAPVLDTAGIEAWMRQYFSGLLTPVAAPSRSNPAM